MKMPSYDDWPIKESMALSMCRFYEWIIVCQSVIESFLRVKGVYSEGGIF